MSDTLWISAGELSGDMHGAALMQALKSRDSSLEFMGMGGPHLRAAGLSSLFAAEDLSVMGLTEVLGHLPRVLRMLSGMKSAMARIRPRALIVIDAPEFHFRLIKIAHALRIPVYYYISPKVWAWRPGRAAFLRDHVRRLISILPFEADFYQQYGMSIDYVGNPLVDIVDYPSLRHISPHPDLIGLLPGSRRREIAALLPEFGKAARILSRWFPRLVFACIRAPGIDEALLRAHWPADVPARFEEPAERWRFMRQCRFLLAASGTVTLESALAGVPTLVAYRLSTVSFHIARTLIRVPYISLANLILNREVFPELLQDACNGQALADKISSWLSPESGPDLLAAMRCDLDEIRRRLGGPGASARAAALILEDLAGTSRSCPPEKRCLS
ncbi:MAG: lipid-A-disaccharide synthase [Desulfovibrio sp.]|jgi:lipid-A-disaccharide synthase|nr:lipid-A-disaccharide synthase [Desulfovibrio sp.]